MRLYLVVRVMTLSYREMAQLNEIGRALESSDPYLARKFVWPSRHLPSWNYLSYLLLIGRTFLLLIGLVLSDSINAGRWGACPDDGLPYVAR